MVIIYILFKFNLVCFLYILILFPYFQLDNKLRTVRVSCICLFSLSMFHARCIVLFQLFLLCSAVFHQAASNLSVQGHKFIQNPIKSKRCRSINDFLLPNIHRLKS